MSTYIPISIGINCTTKSNIQKVLPINNQIPYFPFDWCITGDLLDIARAINNKFKGYLSYIYVNDSNNKMDVTKIKKIILEKKYITKKEVDRKFGGRPKWTASVKQLHKNYPSIIELHYDLASDYAINKIQNRIDRMNKVIIGKKPILFIRTLIYHQMTLIPFFKYLYNEGLQNCHEFVNTLKFDKNRDFKILYIHITLAKDKDFVKHETFSNIDAYEIQSTKPIKYNKVWECFIIPYIKKYKLAIKL
jgi:hypothetical protein